MGDVGEGAELVLEAVQRCGVHALHGLESDRHVAHFVVGFVYHPHATRSKAAHDGEPCCPSEVRAYRSKRCHGLAFPYSSTPGASIATNRSGQRTFSPSKTARALAMRVVSPKRTP